MLNIPEQYKIKVDKQPYKLKYQKEGKTHYKFKCSYCGEYVSFLHGEAKEIYECPYCNVKSPWILKPRTERILFELQEAYLDKIDQELFQKFYEETKKPEEDRDQEIINRHKSQMDQEILTKMFYIVKDYSNSLLKKRIKKKGFHLPPETFIDKVDHITFLWYQQFTEKPGFKITDSWAGQLNWKITEALYASVQDDMMDSLDRTFETHSGDKNQSLSDLAENFNIGFLFSNNPSVIDNPYERTLELSQEMKKLIALIIKSMRRDDNYSSYRESILSLYSLLFFLQRDTKREDYLYNSFGNNIRTNSNKIKMVLRKYLREIATEVNHY